MASQHDVFSHQQYLFRRKVFKAFGGEFRIYSPEGTQLLYSKQKAFKLKEDIRVYSDDSMTNELLTIQARQVIDFSAAYDVVETGTGVAVGALRRKGFKSLLRDEWLLMDTQGLEIGKVQEDSLLLALLRRRLGFIPQKYTVTVGGQPVASFKQHFNPFVLKYTLDLSQDYEKRLDRRLAIAAGVLLCAIERQQSSISIGV